MGEARRPEEWNGDDDEICDDDGNGSETWESKEDSPTMTSAVMTKYADDLATRPRVVKLLRGERFGWWSSQKFDRRVRMRALVMGAVNDRRTRILLDTGANVSVVSSALAKKLPLKQYASQDQQINIQGIGKDKVMTTSKAMVKITLGWEVVYEFEVWIMPHHAGVDLILGTDFMIPAGVRLDLYNSAAKLPDEVVVPLMRSQRDEDEQAYGLQTADGPAEAVCLPNRTTAEFRLRRKQPSDLTHEFWVRRTNDWIPTVVVNAKGRAVRVLLTNVRPTTVWCPAHFPVVVWLPLEVLPPEGYVRLNSAKYRDWQVLAYESAMDKELLYKEQDLYAEWLSRQPPAVEKKLYPWPKGVKERPPPIDGGRELTCAERWAEIDARKDAAAEKGAEAEPPDRVHDAIRGDVGAIDQDSAVMTETNEDSHPSIQIAGIETETNSVEEKVVDKGQETRINSVTRPYRTSDNDDDRGNDPMIGDPEEELRSRYLAAATTDENDLAEEPERRVDSFERVNEDLHLEDYAHELAFLPDLVEETTTNLDYDGLNVKCAAHTQEQATRLKEVLKRNEAIMISSGNALPPPAYGVVCDIDVGDHPPIKQRARRVALKFLKPLYELLKGLLRAKLISFSRSPWASPIVIVLKKNGVDIRLCIDYKMVNAVTTMMEYAMPLVDDLLSELEKYLWFCSLDAASGFWAVMMTSRARQISAFVCALGHFEWLRMPFGLKNAPMIYQRMIDNALWGYVQPKGGWPKFAEKIRQAEEASTTRRQECDDELITQPSLLTKFAADNRALTMTDPLQMLIDSPEGDMFTCGEPEQSTMTPVLTRRSFVDDICFGGETFDECLRTLDKLLIRFAECRISISFSKSIFVQQRVDFLSHEVTASGIRADPKEIKAIAELPYPKSKKGMQGFLGALNYYSRFIQNLAVYGAVLYQLKDEDFNNGSGQTAARTAFAKLQKMITASSILRHFDPAKEVHIMLFANEWALSSTLMQIHEDKLHPVRFCGRVLKDNEANYHPAEKEVLALLQMLKICHKVLAGKILHVYTRFSTLEWVFQSKSLYGRAVSFAVLLSPYHLKIKRIRERDADFVQLLQASITPHIGLDASLEHIAPPSKNSATVRMDPELLYAKLPRSFNGHVLSFDGSAKTMKKGGYGSCSWILWRLPEWDIEIAASAHLPSTTVNIAEYTGMNNGVKAVIDMGITELVIVGDSRLAIQQSMGVIACKKETLQVELARHKDLTKKLSTIKYLHVVRQYNSAADSLATEALETQTSRVVLNVERKTELKTLNRIPEILYAAEKDTEETKEVPTVCATTRSQVRRVHVDDEKKAEAKPTLSKTRTDLDNRNDEQEIQRRQPPQRVAVEDETEFCEIQPSPQDEEAEQNSQRVPNAEDIVPTIVQTERRKRIAKAQDEELRWADLKTYLRGELSRLSFRRVQNAGKVADDYVLSEDGLLYRHNQSRRRSKDDEPRLDLRLVVPTTMVDEVLQNCHNSVEGGHQGIVRTYHRVKSDYYWVGLYADVVKHVQACEDCCTSKSKPHLKGYSPGNVISDRPFHVISMDFVIPLPRTRRGNSALLLFQDHFSGFVIAKAMAETGALEVAKVFEESVFRRFGAPSLIRHDRDPRFMSEVFQKFSEMMQLRSRATLSYRPQANGQQERSVKTMIQTVRVYVEDPLQADWDDIAEKMVHAINNSRDSTRQETPFYLVHGWDARSTLKAMTEPIRRGRNNSADSTAPAEWRREANRQREVALRLAAEYQLKEKAKRAKAHNESLSRVERRAIPSAENSAELEEDPDEPKESLFKEGDQVWLFMERVKPGLTKKLAHRWHGPFRVKRKVEEFAYELELPDKSGYRFYPVIHVSRLKKVVDTGKRPTTRLTAELGESQRFDFDEELLPEDSWAPDESTNQYEVEAILDDELPLSTSTTRNERRFKVKWVGYDEPSWEPLSNLSCGGLLFDYLRQKKRENRLQMVQVADEN